MLDTAKFKEKLERELERVTEELKEVGRKDPSHPGNWEPTETEIDSDHADDTDVADNQESFMENKSIMDNLEVQYRDITSALEKIEKGTYGKCEVSGEDISEERLEANPSARTCVEHAK